MLYAPASLHHVDDIFFVPTLFEVQLRRSSERLDQIALGVLKGQSIVQYLSQYSSCRGEALFDLERTVRRTSLAQRVDLSKAYPFFWKNIVDLTTEANVQDALEGDAAELYLATCLSSLEEYAKLSRDDIQILFSSPKGPKWKSS